MLMLIIIKILEDIFIFISILNLLNIILEIVVLIIELLLKFKMRLY
jgi:hypothetical protein